MNSSFAKVLALTALATSGCARGSSPFKGEHQDARSITHEDGRVTMRMKATEAPYNKFGHLTHNDDLFKERQQQSFYSSASETLFGKQEEDPMAIAKREQALAFMRGEAQAPKRHQSNHKLGQTLYDHELLNESGLMWTGEIFMGGNTMMDVVYDTGSDWLVVEGNTCASCEGNKYNPSNSESVAEQVTAAISERNYGSASLTGREWTDRVCVGLTSCVEDFEFFLIESQTGIREPIDGIFGMSKNAPLHLAPDNGNQTGPLLTEAMFDQGVINEDKFSFYFQHPSEDSWVDFGEPDMSHVREGAELVEMQLLDPDFYWGVYNTAVAFGTTANAYAFEQVSEYPGLVENNSLYSIIDTGSTALMFSALYYEDFAFKLFEAAGIDDWRYEGGGLMFPCDATLPSVYFLMADKWIEARFEDYIYDYGGGDLCSLFILPVNMPMSILGMPIFVDYYSIHEPKTAKVFWAPHTASTKPDVQSGTQPTNQFLKAGQVGGGDSLTSMLVELLLCYGVILLWEKYLIDLLDEQSFAEDLHATYRRLIFAGYFLICVVFIHFVISPVVTDLSAGTAEASYNSRNRSGIMQSQAAQTFALLAGTFVFLKALIAQGSRKQSKVAGPSMDDLLEQAKEEVDSVNANDMQ